MYWSQKLGYSILALTFITELVLLTLQVRAFREHKHVSFLLLSVSTACALLYIAVGQILGFLSHTILAPPLWVFASATVFLFVQMIATVWGTVSLFTSYRHLSVASREVIAKSGNV